MCFFKFRICVCITLCMFFLLLTRIAFASSIEYPKNNTGFVEEKGQNKSFENLRFSMQHNNMFIYFLNDRIVFISHEVENIPNEQSILEQEKGNYNLALKYSAVTTAHRFDLLFLNVNQNVEISGEEIMSHASDYYLSHCPEGILNVSSFKKIRYNNIYSGIDLVFYLDQDVLKYEFELSSGISPNVISFMWEGIEDATISDDGDLNFTVGNFRIEDKAPVSFSGNNEVKTNFVLNENIISFNIGELDNTLPLVIDPGLVWTSSLEYNGYGSWGALKTNSIGEFYVVDWEWNPGLTDLSNYLSSAGSSVTYGTDNTNDEVIISKFSTNGNLLWVCKYGGSGDDDVNGGVEIDGNDNLYIAGTSQKLFSAGSGDFPLQVLTGAFNQAWDGSLSTGTRGYLLKFLPDNTRQWATYLDRGANLEVFDIEYGIGNTIYMCGKSGGSPTYIQAGSIPSGSGYLGNLNGTGTAHSFVLEFNSAGALIWASWLPGIAASTGTGRSSDIAVDKSSGYVYIAGDEMWNFSTPFSTSLITASYTNQGDNDMFYMSFNSSNQPVPAYGNYIGGAGFDKINIGAANGDTELDSNGNLYVCGHTYSANFPTVNPGGCAYFDGIINDGTGITANKASTQDGFLFKINTSGTITYSTFFGGTNYTSMKQLKKDSNDNLWICGHQYPVGEIAAISHVDYYNQTIVGANANIMFSQLRDDEYMEWLSYYGYTAGYSDYFGFDILETGVDTVELYLAGKFTGLTPFGGGYQFTNAATCTGAAKFKNTLSATVPDAITPNTAVDCSISQLTVTGSLPVGAIWVWYTGGCGGTQIGTGTTINIAPVTTTTYYVQAEGACITSECDQITIDPTIPASVSVDFPIICDGESATITAETGFIDYNWSTGESTEAITVSPSITTIYTVTVEDSNGCTAEVSTTITVNPSITPTFASVGPYCSGSAIGALPTTSQNSITGTWSPAIDNTSTTLYTFTPTAGQCASTSTLTITINPVPTAGITNNTGSNNLTCLVTSIDVTATGGGTYSWSGGTTPTTANNNLISPGTYTVTVTNSGCTASADIIITESANEIAIGISTTQLLCNGDCDATATATANGGASPYTFNWSNSASGSTITGLCAGTYNVTVTDANGCTSDGTIPIVTSCFEITDILVNSCGGVDEGLQEMVTLQVGPNPLNTSTLVIDWPNNSWLGVCTDPTFVANVNATITGGGLLIEPVGGVIPAGAEVLIITSTALDVSALDFTNLDHDVYVVFQCAGNTAGHFANTHADPLVFRSLVITFGGACNDSVAYYPNALVNTDGASVAFTAEGLLTLYNNGCVAPILSTNEAVIFSPPVITATASNNSPICEGESLTLTGGNNGYTDYDWSGPLSYNSSTQSPIVSGSVTTNMAGTYSLTVTDANGCTATAQTDVTINEVTATSSLGNDPLCSGDNNGSIDVTIIGGTANYDIDWGSGNTNTSLNSYTITGLLAGTYDITVTDANGCQDIATTILTAPPLLTVSITDQTEQNCSTPGSATVEGVNGTPGYTYTWPLTAGGVMGNTASMLTAGSYSVTIEDANGCSVVQDIIISDIGGLNVSSVVNSEPLCNGDANGEIEVTISGGTASYDIDWGTGNTNTSLNNYTITGLQGGTYNITVTDANGCQDITTSILTDPALLTASITNQTDQNCTTLGSATIEGANGTPNYTYIWPVTAGGVVGNTASGLIAGSYDVTVEDANSCSIIQTVVINSVGGITVTAPLVTNPSCFGLSDGTAEFDILTGTPDFIIDYGSVPITTSSNNYTVNGLSDGNYNITVTDANGCSTQIPVSLSEPAELIVNINVISDVSCNGLSDGIATVTPIGGTPSHNIVWDSISLSGFNQNSLAAGTYSFTVTDLNMCQVLGSFDIDQPDVLSATEIITAPLCAGDNGTVEILPTGGMPPVNIIWQDGFVEFTNSNVPVNTVFSYTLTDANSCTFTNSVLLNAPPPFTVSLTGTDVSCFGLNDGMAAVDVVAGCVYPIFYEWSNGQNNPQINSLSAGVYDITITDFNSCEALASIEIFEPEEIFITISTTDADCSGNTGSASTTTIGGVGTISYSWSCTSATTSNVSGLIPGSHTLTVTDSNSCESVVNFNISTSGNINIAINLVQPILCFGETNGILEAACSSPNTPYQYNWSTGSNAASINNLSAGSYNLTLTDSWGCVGTSAITINEPQQILINETINNIVCYGQTNGAIHLIVSGGSAPYIYVWPNGSTLPFIENLAAGNYSVTVTDFNSCTISETFNVTQSDYSLDVNAEVVSIACFGEQNGEIHLSSIGGTPPINYRVSGLTYNSYGEDHTNLRPGRYYISSTDSNGCTDTLEVVLSEPSQLSASVIENNPSCFGNNDGSIFIIASGGTFPYNYYIDGVAVVMDSINKYRAGSYNISVIDSNGCEINLRNVTLLENHNDCINIPNAFTPNGDGTNDTWIIHNLDIYDEVLVQLYNRWGQQLCESRDPDFEWDGMYNGKNLPAGSYLYIVNIFKHEPYVGIVTIIY